jgi:hypothetical protein
MNKAEIKVVVNELREGKSYSGTDISPLSGCGLSDFPIGKIIRKEVIVMHLRWQALYLNGNIDEEELTERLLARLDEKLNANTKKTYR